MTDLQKEWAVRAGWAVVDIVDSHDSVRLVERQGPTKYFSLAAVEFLQSHAVDHSPQLRWQIKKAKRSASFLELSQQIGHSAKLSDWQLLTAQKVGPNDVQYAMRGLDAVGLVSVSLLHRGPSQRSQVILRRTYLCRQSKHRIGLRQPIVEVAFVKQMRTLEGIRWAHLERLNRLAMYQDVVWGRLTTAYQYQKRLRIRDDTYIEEIWRRGHDGVGVGGAVWCGGGGGVKLGQVKLRIEQTPNGRNTAHRPDVMHQATNGRQDNIHLSHLLSLSPGK
jgi:hypothetical protein